MFVVVVSMRWQHGFRKLKPTFRQLRTFVCIFYISFVYVKTLCSMCMSHSYFGFFVFSFTPPKMYVKMVCFWWCMLILMSLSRPTSQSMCHKLTANSSSVGTVGLLNSTTVLLLDQSTWSGYVMDISPRTHSSIFGTIVRKSRSAPTTVLDHFPQFNGSTTNSPPVNNSFMMIGPTGRLYMMIHYQNGDALALVNDDGGGEDGEMVKSFRESNVPKGLVFLSTTVGGEPFQVMAMQEDGDKGACLVQAIFSEEFTFIKTLDLNKANPRSNCITISSAISRGVYHPKGVVLFHQDHSISLYEIDKSNGLQHTNTKAFSDILDCGSAIPRIVILCLVAVCFIVIPGMIFYEQFFGFCKAKRVACTRKPVTGIASSSKSGTRGTTEYSSSGTVSTTKASTSTSGSSGGTQTSIPQTQSTPSCAQPSEGCILGLGNPLLDIIAVVTPEFLTKYKLEPNNAIVGGDVQKFLSQDVLQHYKVKFIAGGAAQNTIRVAQWFFTKPQVATFFGAIGRDENGERMRAEAEKNHVRVSYFVAPETATGTCVCLITGRNRSLCAYLGASKKFNLTYLKANFDLVQKARLFYTTGFHLMVCFEAQMLLAEHAHAHKGKLFTFNLSAPFVSAAVKDSMDKLLEYVDILFGNVDEVKAFVQVHGGDPERDMAQLTQYMADLKPMKRPRIALITQGSNDALMAFSDRPGDFRRFPVTLIPESEMVDTNGAGDSFCGGFLAAMAMDKPLDQCVAAAMYAATEIIKTSGCTMPAQNRLRFI